MAGPSEGLVTALNKMREMSVSEGSIYHQYVPTIDSDTDITKFGQVILDSNLTPVYNEFFTLLKRIAFFAIENKRFERSALRRNSVFFAIPTNIFPLCIHHNAIVIHI